MKVQVHKKMWEAILARNQIRPSRAVFMDIWEHRVFAFRIAKAIVLDEDAAEDVTQSVLLKAMRTREPIRDVKAFLRLLVVRESLNLRRRPHSWPLSEGLEGRALDFDGRLQVAKVLSELPPQLRAILALSYEDGLSYREMADLLEIPEGTVASRLNAAKEAFRQAWGENDE